MKTLRILVCGGRDYNDSLYVFSKLDAIKNSMEDVKLIIIHGAAKGADSMAAYWAETRNVESIAFPAQWTKYGKAAGFKRNTQMLEEGQPDLVIAFPGGAGTAMMVDLAESAGVITKLY